MSYGALAPFTKTGNQKFDEEMANLRTLLNRKLPPDFEDLAKVLTSAAEGELIWDDANSAPTFAQLTLLGVAFFTGEIDGTTTAATVIGTVPTGKTFFSLGTYVLTQSVDSSSGSTTVTLKVDNGTLVVRSAVACGSSTARNMQVLGGSTANNTQLDAGGGDITVTVTAAATCPAITLVVGVFGALFEV